MIVLLPIVLFSPIITFEPIKTFLPKVTLGYKSIKLSEEIKFSSGTSISAFG